MQMPRVKKIWRCCQIFAIEVKFGCQTKSRRMELRVVTRAQSQRPGITLERGRAIDIRLQCDRANMAVRARRYIVTADIRLVFRNKIQKRPGSAVFLPDEAANDVARLA
jgi:hypothetical protein